MLLLNLVAIVLYLGVPASTSSDCTNEAWKNVFDLGYIAANGLDDAYYETEDLHTPDHEMAKYLLVVLTHDADGMTMGMRHFDDDQNTVINWDVINAYTSNCGVFTTVSGVDCEDPDYWMVIMEDKESLKIYCEDELLYVMESGEDTAETACIINKHPHFLYFSTAYENLKVYWTRYYPEGPEDCPIGTVVRPDTADVIACNQCPDGTDSLGGGSYHCSCDANPEPGDDCDDGSELVYCYADPCSVNTCLNHPNAVCTSNYCGGCNAEFRVEGELVDCISGEPACQYDPASDDCSEFLVPDFNDRGVKLIVDGDITSLIVNLWRYVDSNDEGSIDGSISVEVTLFIDPSEDDPTQKGKAIFGDCGSQEYPYPFYFDADIMAGEWGIVVRDNAVQVSFNGELRVYYGFNDECGAPYVDQYWTGLTFPYALTVDMPIFYKYYFDDTLACEWKAGTSPYHGCYVTHTDYNCKEMVYRYCSCGDMVTSDERCGHLEHNPFPLAFWERGCDDYDQCAEDCHWSLQQNGECYMKDDRNCTMPVSQSCECEGECSGVGPWQEEMPCDTCTTQCEWILRTHDFCYLNKHGRCSQVAYPYCPCEEGCVWYPYIRMPLAEERECDHCWDENGAGSAAGVVTGLLVTMVLLLQ